MLSCCSRSWSTIGAVLAGLAVICGAFAAHGLDKYFPEKYGNETRTVAGETVPAARKYLADFKTAAEYQMYHALGLLLIGALSGRQARRSLQVAGWSFLLGIVLFSGSLYALTLTGMTKLGAITPIGGTLFIVGWIALAIGACPCGGSNEPGSPPP